jgi:hypothetical protein
MAKAGVKVLGISAVLDPGDGGTALVRNASKYLPVDMP